MSKCLRQGRNRDVIKQMVLYGLYDIDCKEILGVIQFDRLKFHLKEQNFFF